MLNNNWLSPNRDHVKMIVFAVFFILIGCKDSSIKTLKDQPSKDIAVDQTKLTCEDLVFEIVKSSDLNLKDYKDYFVRIERIENDSITIQVYFENNLSDNPGEKQMVESTIAWLLFLPNDGKLWDTTADPENPTEVHYKFNNIEGIYKACNISKRQIANKSNVDTIANKDCKEMTIEMGKGEECLVRNSTIENVYANIVKDEEVTDSKYLLTSIPAATKTIEINKEGIIDIEYKVTKDKIEISMNYQGGVTEVSLKKANNNVIKVIAYYAD